MLKFTVIAPLFISETSPAEVAGSLGAINQFMVTAGIMVADILGFIVPYEYKEGSDTILNPDVYTTKVWRVVFIIPGCMAVLQTILVLFVFRSDTPKYYKQNNMIDQVSSVNALIYKGELTSSGRPAQNNSGAPSSEVNRSVLDDEDKQVEAKVPISALFTPRYRMAFTIGWCLAIFQQLTGINAVIFYSGDIFTRGKVGYDSEHSGKIGTMLVGVVNWAAAMIAIPLLTRLGRKFLLISGQIAMGASLLLLGIFAITDSTTAIIVFTLWFVAFFEFSIGPILWLYAAEIMTESGMAAASLITWIVTIIFGLFTSKLFDALTAEGMYFTFTGIDVVGLLFILFLIKETKGKSKEEIQYLYCDEKYYPLQNEKRDP